MTSAAFSCDMARSTFGSTTSPAFTDGEAGGAGEDLLNNSHAHSALSRSRVEENHRWTQMDTDSEG